MQSSDIPAKFPIPFGASAGAGFIRPIPTTSQIGISNGAASLPDGFPPATFSPVSAGGTPPFGQDMNGILLQITQSLQWEQAGGSWYYNSDFATAIGGYPKNAILASRIVAGNQWMSTVDGNTSDPDAFGAGWVNPPNTWATGDMRPNVIPNNIPAGWLPMRSSYTLGAAGSAASYAAADAVFLYIKTWNGFSNAQCPVTGGRGANALADFNALKPIQIYELSGTTVVGNDNSTGRLNGVPTIAGNANITGSLVGENLHVLTVFELAFHSHAVNINSGNESVTHSHSGSATTGGMNASNPHSHPINPSDAVVPRIVGGPNAFSAQAPNLTVQSLTVSATDINHGHDVSMTTGIESAVHTHNVFGNTAQAGADTAHNTVSRSAIVDWLQKL